MPTRFVYIYYVCYNQQKIAKFPYQWLNKGLKTRRFIALPRNCAKKRELTHLLKHCLSMSALGIYRKIYILWFGFNMPSLRGMKIKRVYETLILKEIPWNFSILFLCSVITSVYDPKKLAILNFDILQNDLINMNCSRATSWLKKTFWSKSENCTYVSHVH